MGAGGCGVESVGVRRKKRARQNRRGFIFTLLVFLLFATLFISLSAWNNLRLLETEKLVVMSRAEGMREYITAMQEDLDKMTYISGYRALLFVNDYVILSGNATDDVGLRTQELMENATLYGEDYSDRMQNATIGYWIGVIRDVGQKQGFNATISVYDFKIEQDTPWSVKISYNTSLSVSDLNEKLEMSWYKNSSTSAVINIDGWEDATFPLNSFGQLKRQIEETPFDWNYTFEYYLGLQEDLEGGINQSQANWSQGITLVCDCNVTGCPACYTQQPNKGLYILVTTDSKDNIISNYLDINLYAGLVSKDSCGSCEGITIPRIANAKNATNIKNGRRVAFYPGKMVGEPNISIWDVDNFFNHTKQGYYRACTACPSFLDRMEGNLSAENPNGIESIVDFEGIVTANLIDVWENASRIERSYVDWINFGSTTYPEKWAIHGISEQSVNASRYPPGEYVFWIDDNKNIGGLTHAQIYNLTALEYYPPK